MPDTTADRPTPRRVRKPKPASPDRWLFPLAALFAAATVPLWLVLREGGLAYATWHGHELLFGYALAVAAGFLVTRAGPVGTGLLLASWLAARLAAAIPDGLLSVLAGLSFPAMVLALAAPPLWRGAKRWENRIVPLLLTALLALDALWWLGALRLDTPLGPELQGRALLATLDLFALLMLIIGGRVLPAAMGGYLERRGIARRDHVRRGYELPLAGLILAAVLLDLAGLGAAAGMFCLAVAAVTLVRVSAWQLHHARGRAELWTLALGYLWLIPALTLKGLAQVGVLASLPHALHGLTVGALGTLTLVMMGRTAALRVRRPFGAFRDIIVAALLVGVAAVLRLVAAPALAGRETLLWLAALAWSVAFLILLLRLVRVYHFGGQKGGIATKSTQGSEGPSA
ncbi:MAG: NnrS family protein [Thiohalobacteraceae bacterium]